MTRYRTIMAFLLFPVLSATAPAQEARLSYDLLPGVHYYMEIDIHQNTSSESLYSEEVSLFNRMKLDFRVDSLSPPDLIHLSVQYQDLLLSLLAPGMDLDINSGSGRNRVLTALIDSLTRVRFRLTMKRSGEMISLRGLDSVFNHLKQIPSEDSSEMEVILRTLEEAYGPHAFQTHFNLFVAYYTAVQPIRNWTRDFTYYFNTKPVHMVNRYYLSRTTDRSVTIQGMGMISSEKDFTETLPIGEVKSAVSGSQTYDYQVDKESGWLNRCVSRQRILIETTIVHSPRFPEGLKIPSYTETVFEVTGSCPSKE